MATLHERAVRESIEARLKALRPDSRGRWGRMSVDQMLWHLNQNLAAATGEIATPAMRAPLPRSVMKFLVLRLPWPRGAPTHPEFTATKEHDFGAERERCLQLIAALADRPVEGPWLKHPMFGRMTGREVSRLQAKHFDHHLRQFGV